MKMPIIAYLLSFAMTLVSGLSLAQDVADAVEPEAFTGKTSKTLVTGKNWMVAAANPHAAKAGATMLKQGGNAIDAMVAVQLVLGLVEPQSSGLGGGAFLVFWDESKSRLTTYDGRETAPAIVDERLFLKADGSAMKFFDAVVGGRSVGTPGTVKLLSEVHAKHGKLDWEKLFGPAISLATNGFEVSPRLNKLITASAQSLFQDENARNYFLSEEGVPLFTGTRIINLPYARTLKLIAQEGAAGFYEGENAQAIVDAVRNHPTNPGFLSVADLAKYQIKEREPVCANYRDHEVCGMGPPSSGGLTVGQILKLIEPHDLATLGPSDPQTWRLIGDASRLAFADRSRFMADSDFISMPKGLLEDNYLSDRSKLLGERGAKDNALPQGSVVPGDPPFDKANLWADDASMELPSTSHFSIRDKSGNVVSMTTTIENGFGSRIMVNGYLLNNELTDFSFVPNVGGKPVANRVEAGKRPRSSMAPTIILKNNKPWAAVGSPGGSRIIGYVAKTIVGLIDWDLDIQTAIELPHLVNRFGTYDLEARTPAERLQPALEKLGYKTNVRSLNSGLHGIVIDEKGRLSGGADPRREGIVIAE